MQQFCNNQPVVLLVEDEVLVRGCVADDLEEAGFGVIEAANADDALREFMDDDRVTILFSDINMPGSLDGLSLAHKIFGLRPAVRLILTSGRGSPAAYEMPVGVQFLPKPYDFQSLASLIGPAATSASSGCRSGATSQVSRPSWNPQMLDRAMLIFVEVVLDRTTADVFDAFAVALRRMPEVMECHMVTGGSVPAR